MKNISLKLLFSTVAIASSMIMNDAHATIFNWVDMENLEISGTNGNVQGQMTGSIIANSEVVDVLYEGVVLSNSVLNAVGYWGNGSDPAYIINGGNFSPPTPYGSQMIMVNGGYDIFNTIHFSKAVENPVMAIRSLGSNQNGMEFAFGATFEILSQGTNNGLSIPIDSILYGEDGDGLVKFTGIFDSLSWVINGVEPGWTGFSVGIENVADITQDPSPPVINVTEPSSIWLMLIGLAGLLSGTRWINTTQNSIVAS